MWGERREYCTMLPLLVVSDVMALRVSNVLIVERG